MLSNIILYRFAFHSEMKYIQEECRFDMPKLDTTLPGIYAIIDSDCNIQKIGKADGVLGLGGRVVNYRQNNSKRMSIDKTVQKWNRVMTNELSGKTLYFYYLPITPQIVFDELLQESYQISGCIDLERMYRDRAIKEGYPLLLGKI